jgi:hypothetical protein
VLEPWAAFNPGIGIIEHRPDVRRMFDLTLRAGR